MAATASGSGRVEQDGRLLRVLSCRTGVCFGALDSLLGLPSCFGALASVLGLPCCFGAFASVLGLSWLELFWALLLSMSCRLA